MEKTAVVVFHRKMNKPAFNKAIRQAFEMGRKSGNFKVTAFIFFDTGVKEIRQKVRQLRAGNRIPFDYLLIYAPKEIAKTKEEFNTFCWMMEKDCQCVVKWLKQT